MIQLVAFGVVLTIFVKVIRVFLQLDDGVRVNNGALSLVLSLFGVANYIERLRPSLNHGINKGT